MRPLGIAGRTALPLILLAAAVAVAGSLWLLGLEEENERRRIEERADTLTSSLEAALIDAMTAHRPESMGAVVSAVARTSGVAGLALADRDGRVRFGAGEVPRSVPLAPQQRWEDHRLVSVRPLPNETRCQRCHPASDAVNGAFWAAVDTGELAPHMTRQARRLWTLTGLAVAGMALLLVAVLKILVGRPLVRLRDFAQRLATGDYQARPPPQRTPEIRALADALGHMAEEVDKAHRELEGRVRSRTAELAAALRTAESARIDRENALQRLQAIVDSMVDGVIFVDAEDRIALANEAARRLRNLRGGPGRPLAECHPTATHPVLDRVMGYLKNGGDAGGPHSIIKEKEGRYETTYAPVRGEAGAYLGTVMVIRDIAERRSLENRLLDAERLAGLGQMSAQVAHQLRNPLGAIDGAARYLGRAVPEDTVAEYTQLIEGEVRRVNQFIDALLKVARPVDPHYQPSKVNRLVEEAITRVRRARELPPTALSALLDPDLPPLDVDRTLVVEALVNLMDNALESGSPVEAVTLETRYEMKGGEGTVVVAVRDRGTGIPADQLDEVVRPFVTTKATGTGLGLVLVRRAAEQHRARFALTGREGGGTEAVLRFPVRRLAGDTADAA